MQRDETSTIEVEFITPLRTYARKIGAVVAALVVLVALKTILSSPEFEATAVVAPMTKGNSSDGLSRAMGLASLAGVGVSSGQNAQNFDRFMYLLTSPELARRLITDKAILRCYYPDWDPDHKVWQPHSMFGKARIWLFGQPLPPNPYAFANSLATSLSVRNIPTPDQNRIISSIYVIRFRGKNSDTVDLMLRSIIKESNEMLRQQAANTARKQSAYLEHQLETVRTQEYRDTLIKLYTEQQQTLMLTNSNVPYAGEIISGDAMPARRLPKGTLKLMFITASVTFSLAYFIAIVSFNLRRAKKRDVAVDQGV